MFNILKMKSLFYSFIITIITVVVSTSIIKTDKENNIIHTASRWDEEVWKDIPGQNYVRFYIFNVTNANKYNVSNYPDKPIVREVGPYVYRIKREKFNVSEVLDDGSFYYRERKTYEFQPNLSKGRSEDDIVHVINTALITFGTRGVLMEHYGFPSEFKNMMENEKEELILKNQRVGDVLFNGRNASIYVKYEKQIINLSSGNVPPGFEAFEDGRYGLLKGTNGSHNGLLRVMPRSANKNVGQIISWNDKPLLDAWNGSDCNKIFGSDGSIFPPEISEYNNDLSLFIPEILRSIPLKFKEPTELGGISGYRYTFSDDFLEDIEMRPENQCFCTNKYSRCLKRGTLDIQSLKIGAPYILTYPHFIKSDGIYSDRVDGLITAPSIHESYYDIEPKTGTLLEFKKRFQYNIRIGPIDSYNNNITFFRTMPQYIFPIFWMEESFQLDGDIIAGLKVELENGSEEESTEQPIDKTSPVVTTIKTTSKSSSESTDTIIKTTTTPKLPTYVDENNSSESFVDKYWILDRFKSVNIHMGFITFLIGACLIGLAICIGLLLLNARSTKSTLRLKNTGNQLESNFPSLVVEEK